MRQADGITSFDLPSGTRMTAAPGSSFLDKTQTLFRVSERDYWPTLAVIAVIGFVLRLCGAAGDLWLDEVWSLSLLSGVTSVDQIFWRINHDNNHFLNSVWLYLAGPDASFVVYRALSIVLGTATVFAAAAVTADRGRATQLIAALLFAVSYPMVNSGSEARGYSGMILFTLLAIWALQRRLDGRGSSWALAAFILLGFLSHLNMIATVLVLVVWTAWTLLRRGDRPAGALTTTVTIFLPAFLAVLPLGAVMAYGAWTYGLTIGGFEPFTLQYFLSGASGMAAYFLGLPRRLPKSLLFLLPLLIAGVAAWAAPSSRTRLYLLGIIGIPLLMLALQLPNLRFPRYYLLSIILLLLCLAELIGKGLIAGGWRRGFAALMLVVCLYSNGVSLWRFLELGRGTYNEVLTEMTWDDDASYASSNAFRTQMMIAFYARRTGREATLVRTADMCARRPQWFILEVRDSVLPDTEEVPECDLIYDGVLLTEKWGMSGNTWALYRRR
jgi:4-amino-4-deoxy-L-arabinose transferase-like glycosyltransferase